MPAGLRTVCALLALLPFLTPAAAGQSARAPVPLVRAHAHNDYEHPRPLLDALERGYRSIEADVHLVDGALLVGHDPEDLRPDRTLEGLYLAPLRAAHRAGLLGADGPPLTLLVDIKTEGASTYLALRALLRRYADLVTLFAAETAEQGAVTVIVSGNRPRALMESEPLRFAAYDGRLDDLDAGTADPLLIPLVSSPWGAVTPWRGEGPLPEEARQRLGELVARAHAQGRRLRFWATPDRPAVWQVLYDAGVDLLGTDDLPGLQAFLLARRGEGRP